MAPGAVDTVAVETAGDLHVPEPGGRAFPGTVTVVVPHFESPDALACVLEGLRHQDFPAERLDVVVADDGSAPHLRPRVDADAHPRTTVVRHDRRGARRATTRNLGARSATGDVLCFLDADMVPDAGFVSAHVRHHASGGRLVVGDRTHVDPAGITAATVAAAALEGSVRALLDGRRSLRPAWRDALIRRTDQLRAPDARGWRVAGGGNISLPRPLFEALGGFDERFTGWGGEDLEFAFRAEQRGAHVVWEPTAFAVHLGLEATPSAVEGRALARSRYMIADLVADPDVRRDLPGRRWTIPQTVVSLDLAGHDGPELARLPEALDAALRSSPDIGIVVDLAALPEADRTVVHVGFVGDGRVCLDQSRVPDAWALAPIHVEASGPDALEHLLSVPEDPEFLSAPGPVIVKVGRRTLGRVSRRALLARRARSITGDDRCPPRPADRLPARILRRETVTTTGSGTTDVDLDDALQRLRNLYWSAPRPLRIGLLRIIAAATRLRHER